VTFPLAGGQVSFRKLSSCWRPRSLAFGDRGWKLTR